MTPYSIKFLIYFNILFFISNKIFSQDYIYTFDKQVYKGKIVGFEGNEVIFIDESSAKVMNKHIADITIIFNNKGNFLTTQELLTTPDNRQEAISEYFNNKISSDKYDLLVYKFPVDVIRCSISYESDEIVNFKTIKNSESRTENKKEVLLVIYKDGAHKFYSNPADFTDKLAILKNKIKQKISESLNEEQIIEKPIAVNNSETSKVEIALKNPEIAPKLELNEDEFKSYTSKAKVKVEDFANFLSIITDKNFDAVDKDKAIEQTVKLFTPGSTIQVSFQRPDGSVRIVSRKIEDYLKRLKLSQYSNIKIEWTDIQYINELKQENDGNYYGKITGEQRFSGFDKNGNIKYGDVTRKNVKVMVKSYKKIIEAIENNQWEVLLGNIGVVETIKVP